MSEAAPYANNSSRSPCDQVRSIRTKANRGELSVVLASYSFAIHSWLKTPEKSFLFSGLDDFFLVNLFVEGQFSEKSHLYNQRSMFVDRHK